MVRKTDSHRFAGRHRQWHAEEHANRRAGGLRIRLDSFGMTQMGQKRRSNQDRFFSLPVGSLPNCLLGVADGIGGGPAGLEASSLVAETFQRFVGEESGMLIRPGRVDGEILETLTRGLRRCHEEMQHLVENHPEWSGMGTTLTSAVVLWPKMYLVHVGDARAYILSRGSLRRLTRDHTYAQALLEAGVLNESTVRSSAMRRVLSNFISGDLPEKDPEVHPDVTVAILEPGDTLLLCTDGLTDVLTDEEIGEELKREESPEAHVTRLLGLARDREARDDTTAVVARFAMVDDLPAPSRRRHHPSN
jgi:PPM family protein phosphatase